MELESQKAELLHILHDQGVYLTRDDFKPSTRLKWKSGTPAYIKAAWPRIEKSLQNKTALEEPSTGYFFAASFNPSDKKWSFVCAPGPDNPRPVTGLASEDKLNDEFKKWATWLARELESPRPWSRFFQPGELPLTLWQIAEFDRLVKDCGLNYDDLEIGSVNVDTVRIKILETDFWFSFTPGWNVGFTPGEYQRFESVNNTGWSSTLSLFEDWTGYLRRESDVFFPTAPVLEIPKRPILQLKSLKLSNIRRFSSLTLTFDKSTNLFCGQNGTGKSTVLRSLAIGLCHEADTAALVVSVPGGLVTLGKSLGTIEVVVVDAEGTEFANRVEIGKKDNRDIVTFESKEAPETFLCGYGSVFSMDAQQSQSEYSVRDATRSLFDYNTKLFSLEIVLRRLRDRLGDSGYEERLRSLSSILSFDGSLQVQKGSGVEVSENGHTIPFDGLADGYRVSFSWLVDFLGWAMSADAMENGQPRGILLVDEVDKHMHPTVQATLVEKLEKALPGVQKILTSHNPLTILGARPESIFVIEDTREGVRYHHAPDFRGYSVEDVYTDSELFDTEPYSPELQRLRDRYEELASVDKSERSETDNEELVMLASKLRSLQMPIP